LVPVGMAQGKWTVRLDPYTRESIVQRYTMPWGKEYDHRFLPLPAEEKREYFTDFESRILDHIERPTNVPAEVK
jgi:hypothetical protein